MSSSSQKKYFCTVCLRSFKTGIHLRVHTQTHKRDLPASSIPVNEDSLCIICYEKERSAILSPCSHTCLCVVCAAKLLVCPICRTNIDVVGYKIQPTTDTKCEDISYSDPNVPPRPPVLSNLSSIEEISKELESWKVRAKAWQEAQQANQTDVQNYSAQLEDYSTKLEDYSSNLEDYGQNLEIWQNELNQWWEMNTLPAEDECWFKIYDPASKSHYFYEQNSGRSQWEEPLSWTEYVEEHMGEKEKAPGLKAILRIQRYIRNHKSAKKVSTITSD